MEQYEETQQQVVELSQALVAKGFLMGTGGNISVRIPGQAAALAITPSNFDYTQMTAGDVCVLDGDLRLLAGARKPSIESGMHAAVYALRPDARVVVHTHQVTASAVALLGRPIPALFDEQVRFLGRSVELVAYAPSGTGWLKSRLAARLKNHCNAYILQNHGALVLADTPERALHNVELLEKCAAAFLLAYYTGERLTRIPAPIREIIFAKLRKDQKSEEL
ncbi:MAG: class II aldolase/adducin family protein [Chloroflexota bacterium]